MNAVNDRSTSKNLIMEQMAPFPKKQFFVKKKLYFSWLKNRNLPDKYM